ncbi:MAG: NAD(P)/FAD-dependent oxidoreductase [Candidatus Limnocylindrales bacterium]
MGSSATERSRSPRVQHIVVLGGGFAGVSAAQELVRRLRRQGRLADSHRPGARDSMAAPGGPVSVTLISRDNYFVFQPLLADIVSGAIETTHVVVPLRRMLRGVEVEVGNVEEIDPVRRRVQIRRRQSDARFTVDYDALVVALGSVTDFDTVPGMADHAIGVRSLGDAFYLRNRALSMLEEAASELDPERQKALLTFVVVGGGSTGVEVAAELEDLLRTARRTFTNLPEPEVVLVHSRANVLSEFGERLARYATRKLGRAGVRLVLKHRLVRVEADRVELDDGTSIATATVVSTVGNAPHPVVARLGGSVEASGWIRPDATFAVPGLDRVWALGDCASILDPRTGRPMPATAQHAVREGPHAARNILAVLDGGRPLPFDYGQQGMLVSLGRFNGVGEVLGIKVSGFVAWFLWRTYYLLRLPSRDRRLRVALDWALELVLAHDVIEISMRRTRTRPGEEVGEVWGEPVSAGVRAEAEEELVL